MASLQVKYSVRRIMILSIYESYLQCSRGEQCSPTILYKYFLSCLDNQLFYKYNVVKLIWNKAMKRRVDCLQASRETVH